MRQLETHCLDNDPTRLGRKRSLAWKIEKKQDWKSFQSSRLRKIIYFMDDNIFVGFLVQMKTLKFAFAINSPLQKYRLCKNKSKFVVQRSKYIQCFARKQNKQLSQAFERFLIFFPPILFPPIFHLQNSSWIWAFGHF